MEGEVLEFLRWAEVEAGLARNTLAAYRRDLADFDRFLKKSPSQASAADLLRYLGALRAAGRAETTLGRRFACLRTFYRFLVAEGLLRDDPTSTLDAPRRWRTLPRVPSREDVEKLLDSIAGTTPKGRRDRALFELLYATGARVAEATGARVGDYQEELSLLRLRGKGSKERVVPVGRRAKEAIAAHWADRPSRPPESPLVASLRGRPLTRDRVLRILGERAAEASLGKGLTPHSFRHAFATHLLEGRADVRAVQELLGHASVATTQLYTHVEQDRLKAIHARFHPRATSSRPAKT